MLKGKRLWMMAIVALLASGCGGGGGDGGSAGDGSESEGGGNPEPTLQPARIGDGGVLWWQMETNVHGNLLLAWQTLDMDGDNITDSEIRLSTKSRNGEWSTPITWSNTEIIFNPAVAYDDNGDGVLTWNAWSTTALASGSVPTVWSSTYINGQTSEPAPLAGDASSATLASEPGGGPAFVALWQNNETDTLDGDEYRLGTGNWVAIEPVELRTAQERLDPLPVITPRADTGPALAVLPGGQRMAVWQYNAQLRYNLWMPGVGWGDARVIAERVISPFPPLQAAADGTAMLTWLDLEGEGDRLMVSRYDGTGWSTPQAVVDLGRTGPQGYRAEYMAAGEAVVVWPQISEDSQGVWSLRLHEGVWQEPVLIKADAGDLALASNPEGDVVAAMLAPEGLTVMGLPAGSETWSEVGRFEVPAVQPVLALDSDGRTTVAWMDANDGSLWSLTLMFPGQ